MVFAAVRGWWSISPLFAVGLIVLQLIGEHLQVVDCWEIAGAVRNGGAKSGVRNCRTLRLWDGFSEAVGSIPPGQVGERLVINVVIVWMKEDQDDCGTMGICRDDPVSGFARWLVNVAPKVRL